MKNILLTSILLLLTPFITKGAVVINEIVINEIMYNLEKGSDSGREWVEIFNDSDAAIDLTDWRFYENDTNHKLTLIQGDINISPNRYAVIVDKPDQFLADNPGYSGTLFDSAFSLSNSGENLAIKDADLKIINQVTYNSSWGADGDGNSLQRKDSSSWGVKNPTPGVANNFSTGEEPEEPAEPEEEPDPPVNETPLTLPSGDTNNQSSVTDAEIYPTKVFINEFLPSPVGKDAEREWIEIYNDSDQIIDISGWQLDDEDGGSKPFVFPENTLIISKGFLVFPRQITKIALNNDSDKVRLLLPTGTVFQEISYEKAPEGQSSTKTPTGFVWSTPTPGLPNIISAEEQNPNYDGTPRLETTEELPENQQKQDETYYNLANLEKSTGSNSKPILIILTIAVVIFAIGIGIIKFKKKKY